MTTLQTVLAGLLALGAFACGSGTAELESAPVPQKAAAATKGTAVQIDNQNFSDMNIYVLQAGGRALVGQAQGLGKTTLVIPNALTSADGRVRLLADPIGGYGPITTPVLLVPFGQQIYWTIGSDPTTSTASTG